ncbi:MAG: PIN domain-containing protein [Puniceicoccales bacterium]|jgi:predicted nucleic acid-binding protein|nr:PIN domain-containing protein [Puniceicoccales bacterium]
MVLVDTCVWITANKRGMHPEVLGAKVVLESLLNEGEAAFCDPVRLEFLGAVRREFRQRFDLMFSVVPCLPMSAATWESAVRLGRLLKDKLNLTVPWNDILIAAIALENGVQVYSLDNHFFEMADCLGVRLYAPGEGGKFTPENT